MAKKKESKIVNSFKIFFEGIKLYFYHIDKFLAYMSFPVLGQIVGIILVFGTIHLFAQNAENVITANPLFNNVLLMFIILILLIVPSFALFLAAFWKYMVAMASVNSMAKNLMDGAKLEDLKMHNDVVSRRTTTFLGVLLILSVISLIGIIPLLWVILLIFMVYLSLVFQAFALEENLNCIEIVQKSINLVKGNFLRVSFLLIILWFFTYFLLPHIFNLAFEKLALFNTLATPVEAFCSNLPVADVQTSLQGVLGADFVIDLNELAQTIVKNLISAVIIGYTLPLRGIYCTLLYKDLETKKLKEKKIKEL